MTHPELDDNSSQENSPAGKAGMNVSVNLDKFFQLSVDLLCIADLEGYFRRINEAWEHTLGYSEDELLGRPFIEFVHPDDRERTLQEMQRLGQGFDALSFQNRYRRKSGGYCWLEWQTRAPLPGETLLYAAARDITVQKQAENQISQLRTELEHASLLCVMGEMAAGMAHEFHQPLEAIVNYAGGCIRRIQNGKMPQATTLEVLEDIRSEALRAGQLLSGIREFVVTRRTVGSFADVDEVVANAMRTIDKSSELDCHIEYLSAQSGLKSACDPILLMRVLLNLLMNSRDAVKRHPPPRRIVISSRLTESAVELVVHDSGPGIPDELKDRIFDQFFTTKPQGTGLGLAMSRSIIERMGGELWFVNSPEGPRFHFTVPLPEDDTKEENAEKRVCQ